MSTVKSLGDSIKPTSRVSHAPKARHAKVSALAVGVLVLDSSFNPVYCNSEALRIFAYPKQAPRALDPEFLQAMRSILEPHALANDFPITSHFVSGRRRYLCRHFVLEAQPVTDDKPVFLIVLERQRPVLLDLAARYQLTDREVEAIQHLTAGLTSKEIAQRMRISPNTVRAFLRLIMLKMGVTTRSGVIGKLINLDPIDER